MDLSDSNDLSDEQNVVNLQVSWIAEITEQDDVLIAESPIFFAQQTASSQLLVSF